jgi:aminoglycoside phosphotransferase (APT) family kinase protein
VTCHTPPWPANFGKRYSGNDRPADDRQDKFTGTKEVVGVAIASTRRSSRPTSPSAFDGFQTPLEVRQFKGGQSNPTYKLITPNRNYVLRRKPPGKLLPSAHAVDREFRIISALHPTGFPVAKPYLLCEDESVIGTMFYVMDCVEGRIYWGPMLPDQTPKQRHEIYDAMNETFARLHNHRLGKARPSGLRQARQLRGAPGFALDQAISALRRPKRFRRWTG